jgi:hypothetical protein
MSLQICILEVSGSSLTIMDEMFLFRFSQMTIVDFGSTLQTCGSAWIAKSLRCYGLDNRDLIPDKGRNISH